MGMKGAGDACITGSSLKNNHRLLAEGPTITARVASFEDAIVSLFAAVLSQDAENEDKSGDWKRFCPVAS